MNEKSAIEKLDDAIHEYIQATADEDDARTVKGWAIAVETTKIVQIEDAFPLADAQWYVLGPQTTTAHAAGLAQYLRVVTEQAMWRGTDE